MNKNKIILTLAAIAVFSVSSLSFSMSISDVIIDKSKTEDEKIKIIGNLLKKGENINEVSMKAMTFGTPLHNACAENYPKIVEFLLNNGADANMADQIDGIMPLWYACDNANPKIVKLLLPHCTNHTISAYSQKSLYKGTPLDAAFKKFVDIFNFGEVHKNSLEVIKLLLQYGAKIVQSYEIREWKKPAKILSESIITTNQDKLSRQENKILLTYLTLANDYDNAVDKTQFLDNLWKKREAYRKGKEKKPNEYGLEDAYNILAWRSFAIKPLKIQAGQTLFSGKKPEQIERDVERLAKMAERVRVEKEGMQKKVKPSVTTKPVEVGPKGGKKKFVPLTPTSSKKPETKVVTKTDKKAPVVKTVPAKKTESQLRFEETRAKYESK